MTEQQTPPLKVLVIDRSIWRRHNESLNEYDNDAGASYYSSLRDDKNRLCCLGIYCKSLGVSDEDLENQATPYCVSTVVPRPNGDWLYKPYDSDTLLKYPYLQRTTSDIARDMMHVNDDVSLSEDDRERKLTYLFTQIGIELKFVN